MATIHAPRSLSTSTLRRRGALAISATVVAAATLGVSSPAFAKHGGDAKKDDVRASVACGKGGALKLKAKPDDAGIEVEVEVDSNVKNQQWLVDIADNAVSSWHGTGTTAGPSGSFQVSTLLVPAAPTPAGGDDNGTDATGTGSGADDNGANDAGDDNGTDATGTTTTGTDATGTTTTGTGTDDPATHDAGDDNGTDATGTTTGTDDPASHDAGDDKGGKGGDKGGKGGDDKGGSGGSAGAAATSHTISVTASYKGQNCVTSVKL